MPLIETTISVHRPKYIARTGSLIGGGDISGDYVLGRPIDTPLRENRCGDAGKSGARYCAFMRFDFPMPPKAVATRSLLTLTAETTEAAIMTAAFGFARTRPFGFAATTPTTPATSASRMGWDQDDLPFGAYGLNTFRGRARAADATVLGATPGTLGPGLYEFRADTDDQVIGSWFSELDYSKTVQQIQVAMSTASQARPNANVWVEIWKVSIFDYINFGFGDNPLYRIGDFVAQSAFLKHDDLPATSTDYNTTFTFSPEVTLAPGTLYAMLVKSDADPDGPFISCFNSSAAGFLTFPRDQSGKTGFQINNQFVAQQQYPYPTDEADDTLIGDRMFSLSTSAKTANFSYPATTVGNPTTFGDASYSADVVVDLTGLLNFCLQQPEWALNPASAVYANLMPMCLWMSTFTGPNAVLKTWYNTLYDDQNATTLAPTWKIEYEVAGCLVAVPRTLPAVAAESNSLAAVTAESNSLPAVRATANICAEGD